MSGASARSTFTMPSSGAAHWATPGQSLRRSSGRADACRSRSRRSYPGACRGMNEAEVSAAAAEQVELVEPVVCGECVWGWARGDDERWQCYREQRQAIEWTEDRLARCAVCA
jgi:hypothetical protein